jgi:hypothetical protein
MRSYKFNDFPQKFIVIDNYFEEDEYLKLEKNFPHIDEIQYLMRFSALDPTFKYDKKIWIPVIKEHLNREYFESTCLLFEDHLIKWRPKLWEKIKSQNYTFGPRYSGCEIQYNFKFGVGNNENTSGKQCRVHVDIPILIFQSMIYLKHPEDQSNGGDIHLTEVKEDGSLCNTVRCKYTHNRCLIFPHHPSGWHFVGEGKSKYKRKGVGVIFEVRDDLQEISPEFFEQKI